MAKKGSSGEVDFVCDRGGERLYVQVAYVLADEKTREREFGALEKLRSLDRKLLLTMDRIDMGEGTVKHMYIPDFMVSHEQADCLLRT